MQIFKKEFRKFFATGLIFGVLLVLPAAVLAITSTSYEIIDGGSEASHHSSTSTSYKLEGSIEYLTGRATSTTYVEESGSNLYGNYCGDNEVDTGEDCDGSDLNSQTCVTRGYSSGTLSCNSDCTFNISACASGGGGGGGGGGGAAPAAPTINATVPTTTYNATELLSGTREAASNIYINNVTAGVTYPTTTTWQKLVTLQVGTNTFNVRASNANGSSTSKRIIITRLAKKYGDANGDEIVNDYDLSKLAYYWGTSQSEVDFNKDGRVDDYDLSLMAAYWDTGA